MELFHGKSFSLSNLIYHDDVLYDMFLFSIYDVCRSHGKVTAQMYP